MIKLGTDRFLCWLPQEIQELHLKGSDLNEVTCHRLLFKIGLLKDSLDLLNYGLKKMLCYIYNKDWFADEMVRECLRSFHVCLVFRFFFEFSRTHQNC